jgi:hypothetical protein
MKLELLLHLFILTVEVPKYHTEDGRIARDESNKNVYVSSDMTYKQYKEKFIKKEVEIVKTSELPSDIMKLIEKDYGKLNNKTVILMKERLEHI